MVNENVMAILMKLENQSSSFEKAVEILLTEMIYHFTIRITIVLGRNMIYLQAQETYNTI